MTQLDYRGLAVQHRPCAAGFACITNKEVVVGVATSKYLVVALWHSAKAVNILATLGVKTQLTFDLPGGGIDQQYIVKAGVSKGGGVGVRLLENDLYS